MQVLMRAGAILGLWFVIEYLVFVMASQNIMFNLIHTPMMFVTPVLLFMLVRKLRQTIYSEVGLRFFQVLTYGVQMMFFAGLIEAFFIYAYNQWLFPTNLMEMRQALLSQYAEVTQMMESVPGNPLGQNLTGAFNQAHDILKEAPVERPIDAALNAISNDILYGILWMIPFGLILKKKS